VLVSDYSLNGLKAAERVRDLANEMKLQVGRSLLVVNRAPVELSGQFTGALAATGIETAGCVPVDPLLPEFEIAARTVMELPDDSPRLSGLWGRLRTPLLRTKHCCFFLCHFDRREKSGL